MKKLVLIILVFVAVVSTASSDVQSINPPNVDLNLNINVGIPMKSAFRIYFDALEPGSPITVAIPVGFTDPKICCYPNCGSTGYCCFKC